MKIKKVFTKNMEVIEAWLNQKQDEARTSDRRIYFQKTKLYIQGWGFDDKESPMAEIIDNKMIFMRANHTQWKEKGIRRDIEFYNSSDYIKNTYKIYYVIDWRDHFANLNYMLSQIKSKRLGILKTKSFQWWDGRKSMALVKYEELQKYIQNINTYIKDFHMDHPLLKEEDWIDQKILTKLVVERLTV